jgi:hypothetical protein
MRPTIISVSGFSSEVGKTTLLCQLLRRQPGWEAIKMTRGHYRSCGKDPHACCVSPLLGEKPLVLSGREATFQEPKDTGRYWGSGAGNVHWVIGTDDQIEEGLAIALERVDQRGVFIEGNSFLKYVEADYSIMVARPSSRDIKSSAVAVMPKMRALFVPGCEPGSDALATLQERLARRGSAVGDIPVFFEPDMDQLGAEVAKAHQGRCALPDA